MTEIYSHISNKDVKDIVLKEIYNVKDLTPEQKNKYDEEIELMQKQIRFLMGNLEVVTLGVKQRK